MFWVAIRLSEISHGGKLLMTPHTRTFLFLIQKRRVFSVTMHHRILYSYIKCTTKVCEAEMTMTRCRFTGLLIHIVISEFTYKIPWQNNEAIENAQCLVFVSLLYSIDCKSNRELCVSLSLWKHVLALWTSKCSICDGAYASTCQISSSEYMCPHLLMHCQPTFLCPPLYNEFSNDSIQCIF